MRLKIISDGTSMGTRVVNADTGEALKNVKSVTFAADGTSLPITYLELYGVHVELDGITVERWMTPTPKQDQP